MRRSVATTVLCFVPALVAGASLLAGCEDGPNQTFTPATGILFNSGNIDASSGAVEAGLDASYVSHTVLEVCSAELKRTRWSQMLQEPMAPPALFAGLDLRGCGITDQSQYATVQCEWPGLKVEDAERAPTLQTTGPSAGKYEGGNCQGTAAGSGGCGENQNDICGNVVWGDNGEVNFSYDLGTHYIDQLDISLGYLGTMTFNSPDPADPIVKANANCQAISKLTPPFTDYVSKKHTYVIQMGLPILKDGAPYIIDWGTNSQVLAELYDAMTYTFDPGSGIAWPGCSHPFSGTPPKGGCMADGTCLYNSNDGSGTGYFGARPLATYILFHSTLPAPANSQPFFMYIDYAKFVPNSSISPTLSINNSGPFTDDVPQGILPGGTPCHQFLGQTFGDYKKTCIMPYAPAGDPSNALNATNFNKLVGGHTHNLEEITFDVVGVNEDFALSANNLTNKPLANGSDLGAFGIVSDTQLPADGDLASEFYFDVRAYGKAKNEYCYSAKCEKGASATTPVGDYRASAMIVREYQRLVLLDLAKQNGGTPPTAPGDCQFFAGATPGNKACADYKTGKPMDCPAVPTSLTKGARCTGMEGMVIPGNPAFPGDGPLQPSYQDLNVFGFGLAATVLRPGDHYAIFLTNPNFAGPQPYDYGAFWDASLVWVTRVMGNGDVNSIPSAARDRRYYFKWFGVAYVKYMKNYGHVAETGGDVNDPALLNPTTVANQQIDLETLWFDNESGAQFDKFEYVDLGTIAGYAGNPTKPDPAKPYLQIPFDVEYGTDVKIANQRYTNWYRRLDREEFALYQALSPNKADPPSAHANFGVNLTNLFGSSILANATCGGSPAIPCTYECAAGLFKGGKYVDPTVATHCAKQHPPSWALDPATGDSMLDLNGQMAAEDKAHAAAYHAYGTATPNTLLWQYPAAFSYPGDDTHSGNTIFSGPNKGNTTAHSPIQVCPIGATNCPGTQGGVSATSNAVEAAQVMMPNFKNPWQACAGQVKDNAGKVVCDPNQAAGFLDPTHPQLFSLVPWLPSQPGVGFSIAVNGTSSIEVQTAQLDFTGNLETYLVDYVPYQDPSQTQCAYPGADAGVGGCNQGYTCQAGTCVASDNSIEIRAIEAHDFLGEVFVCQDQTTSDVLHIRMYTSVFEILEWLAAHPGDPNSAGGGYGSAQTGCNMVVRYSPFDNYPDFITSLAPAGSVSQSAMTLNTNQGQGFGRIVDVTLFNSLYETITQ